MNSSTDKVIARVGRAHGIRGEVTVRVVLPDSGVLTPGRGVLAGNRRLTIRSARPNKDAFLVAFEEIADRNGAEELRGLELLVPSDQVRALEPDEFWPEQLIGLTVLEGSDRIGTVVDVVAGTAQDRLVVEGSDGNRFEVPFVDELVPDVLPEEGVVRVTLINGIR